MLPAIRTRPKKEIPMSDQEPRTQIELTIDNLMRRDLISRRTFMRRAGRGGLAFGAALTLPSLLAACATPGASQSASLRWLNWPLYIDLSDDEASYPSLVEFTAASGIEVEYNEGLLDNAEFLSKYSADLRAGNNTGWDVMSPGGWVVERMARLGWLEEIDHSKLPNWTEHCADYAKGLWFDPDNKYSVWWQGGITGIAYDPNLTGREITTFDDLLDPAFSGKVGGFSDMRDMFGLTLLSLDVEPANATVDDVKKAQEKLLDVPDNHFRGFYGNEYYESLVSGDLAISVAWSGDISQMNLYDNDAVKFIVPDSGGMRWNDNLVIPKGGASIDNAHKLMDYYYDPTAAAMLSEWVGYFTPVKDLDAKILEDAEAARADDPEWADTLEAMAPTVIPNADQIDNTYADKELSEEEEKEWNDLFEAVLGA
jgi:spermidine/putrescine transport system substrate-binding protein